MRVIHTSDWHLGHELYGFDRGVEHDVFLNWLAHQLIELGADALIVTGDIYDTVNPSIPAQQLLYRFVRSVLAETPHLQIVLIGGNHDSAARLELPKELLDANRVHLIGGMPRHQGRPALARVLVELHDATRAPRAVCAAVPYLRPGDLPVSVDGESPLKMLYREVIKAANVVRGNLPLVVTGHLHMSGGVVSELSERRLVIGDAEAVSSDTFPAGIAYVALGHLHRPQSVLGQTLIRYAGSPFPMSVTEKDYEHSIVIIDLDETGGTKTDLMRTPRPVAFYRVPPLGAAALEDVEDGLRRLEIADPGADRRPFLEVAVQLNSAEPDLGQRIQTALEGKPVRMTRIVRQTAGPGGTLIDSGAATTALDDLKPEDVFARRHAQEYGIEPPDDLKKAFYEILAAVLSHNEDRTGAV
jgi:exonuclease SbcD